MKINRKGFLILALGSIIFLSNNTNALAIDNAKNVSTYNEAQRELRNFINNKKIYFIDSETGERSEDDTEITYAKDKNKNKNKNKKKKKKRQHKNRTVVAERETDGAWSKDYVNFTYDGEKVISSTGWQNVKSMGAHTLIANGIKRFRKEKNVHSWRGDKTIITRIKTPLGDIKIGKATVSDIINVSGGGFATYE